MQRFYAGFEDSVKNKVDEDCLLVSPNDCVNNVLGGLGTGNSVLHTNVMDEEFASTMFDKLMNEVQFQEMNQAGGVVPRLVAIQGISLSEIGLEPIYRHPTDDELPLRPMTPSVLRIKRSLENLGYGHEFNHVLIQLYREGKDHINEHSDKTLDIFRGTNIVNFSVGASRTFLLKLKKESSLNGLVKSTQKIALPTNSAFICSWDTNAQFLHSIRPDKREDKFKKDEELYNSNMRISLTFRTIATYRLNVPINDSTFKIALFGQGAKIKTLPATMDEAIRLFNTIDHEDPWEESLRLLSAFSCENRTVDFDWDKHYGQGFEVIKIQQQ